MSNTLARFAALQHSQRTMLEQLVELSLRHTRQSGRISAQFIAAVANQHQQVLHELAGGSGPVALAAAPFVLLQSVTKQVLPYAQEFYEAWLKTQTEAATIAISAAMSTFAADDDAASHLPEAARSDEVVSQAADQMAQPAAPTHSTEPAQSAAAPTPSTLEQPPVVLDPAPASASDTKEPEAGPTEAPGDTSAALPRKTASRKRAMTTAVRNGKADAVSTGTKSATSRRSVASRANRGKH